MKYLVASDIHGSYFYAKKLDNIIEKEEPEKIILLGDLYTNYAGTANLSTKEYNKKEVAKILNKYKDIILCTKGNCDTEDDEKISDFKIEDHIQLKINGVDFFFSHGHVYNAEHIPPVGDVIVYGHFHIGFLIKKDGLIFANPGSISLPRNNSAHSYMIINENKLLLKDIDGEIINKLEYKPN